LVVFHKERNYKLYEMIRALHVLRKLLALTGAMVICGIVWSSSLPATAQKATSDCRPHTTAEGPWDCNIEVLLRHASSPESCPPGSQNTIAGEFYGVKGADSAWAELRSIVVAVFHQRGPLGTIDWFTCQGFQVHAQPIEKVGRQGPSFEILIDMLSNPSAELLQEIAQWSDMRHCFFKIFGMKFGCTGTARLYVNIEIDEFGSLSMITYMPSIKPVPGRKPI
jgi:hypothetical protein